MLIPDSSISFAPAASRVTLLTGATGQLGRAMVRALAGPGQALALSYRSNEKLAAELCAEAQTAGAQAIAVRADLAKDGCATQLVQQVRSALGEVDCLVHAAAPAICVRHPLEWEEPEFASGLQTQVVAFLQLCQAVLPSMQARQIGVIVPLLSTVVDAARPKKWCSYTTAKFALAGAAAGLATDIAETGVRVVGLMLGRVSAAEDSRGVLPEDAAALLRRVCDDATTFPNGTIARRDHRGAKVGQLLFQGREI